MTVDMSSQKRDLIVFVAHAFSPKNKAYSSATLKASIDNLIKQVVKRLEQSQPGLSVSPVLEMREYGEILPEEVESRLSRSHFAIVDISDNNPNVLYELGQLTARNVPYIITKFRDPKTRIPSDLLHRFVAIYDDVAAIPSLIEDRAIALIRQVVSERRISDRALDRLWFPTNTRDIIVVCGPELNPSIFADKSAPNFIYLDLLEDKDAILEISMFLSRQFPKARIHRIAAPELPLGHLEGDLVVIGGPGESDGPGNSVCKLMMAKIESEVSYSDDCESMYVKGNEYSGRYDKNGRLELDYGYFARFRNPLSPDSTVILINGLHTFATLGASMAFTDRASAQTNIAKARQLMGNREFHEIEFECYFPVNVYSNSVECPTISESSFRVLGS
jgi:hypothetical protein